MLKYLVTAAALLTAGAASAQMTLPGKFEVTDTGSASYTIPISIVPGTAGLEPKLSLQYDSRSGNGLLGVGWSLAGLPAITRCGRTIAQDGAVGGVSYDANDRFCLDGQRLIAISGAYGADQTEYRTERESFSKVVSYGTVSGGSGPSWFKVWTKAGLVMEFGYTNDSKIEAQGKSSVRVWALNKTTDTKGNNFTVRYLKDTGSTGTGEYRPLRINYNGAEGTATNNSVRFEYETRPDIVPMYQAGSLIKTTQRMTKVQAWQGENLVREYFAAYVVSSATQNTIMSSIALCQGGDCSHRSTLQWTGQVTNFAISSNIAGQDNVFTAPGWSLYTADFNGDGRADVLWHYNNGAGSSSRRMWRSRSDGGFDIVDNVAGQDGNYTASTWRLAVGDFNADGRADILWHNASGANTGDHRLWLAREDGGFDIVHNVAGQNGSYGLPAWRSYVADFNGDGKSDVLWHFHDSTGSYRKLWLSRSDGSFDIVHNLASQDGNYTSLSWRLSLGDFNGDGLTDIRWHNPAGGNAGDHRLWLGKGDGTFNVITNVAGQNGEFGLPAWKSAEGDFNGDGRTDVLWYYADGQYGVRKMWLGRGDGGFDILHNIAGQDGNYTNSEWRTSFSDIDGDGRTDILWYLPMGPNSSDHRLWLSRGDSNFTVINNLAGQNNNYGLTAWKQFLGDFNGDGKTDILWHYADGTTAARHLWSSQGESSDLIRSVSSVVGAGTAVAYHSIATVPTAYSKDTGLSACAYPCMDVQAPLYVVSEVSSSAGVKKPDGTDATYRSTYRYTGAKADQHGRGFLGFRQMTVRDEQTGIEQVTTYRQVDPVTKRTDHAFVGLVASREKKLGTQLLNRSTNVYGSYAMAGNGRFPFLKASAEESWELSGAPLPGVLTSYEYDGNPTTPVPANIFGNVTRVTVQTGGIGFDGSGVPMLTTPDGHSKTTVSTYDNDAANWLLGRLRRSEVTSTTPGN